MSNKPKRISLMMGACEKIGPHYFGSFEVLERVGSMAYKLSLPPMVKEHNLFHVSLLKKCIHDYNHIIDWTMIQVDPEGEL
jgi:hypothetical protein